MWRVIQTGIAKQQKEMENRQMARYCKHTV